MVFSRKWDSVPPTSLYHAVPQNSIRPSVAGKSVYRGDSKVWIKGVTYGTFRPDEHGNEFHNQRLVESDFRAIAANGFNAVRTYTVPPFWLLELAGRYGLSVMVGLPWEQHITFLDSRERQRKIRSEIRERVRKCAGHPSILCYALGSEIPAPIARWYGARRIERFLNELWSDAKSADAGGLFTYVNYPSTEYLNLDFADLFCFNVYLESRQNLGDYLAHLHNLAGDRPVVLAELGLDSQRNGENRQADVLKWQVRTAFAEGCAGAFIFSWTDEWHRGGLEIDDWAFGLTDRLRRPKPALSATATAFSEVPFPASADWPTVSVVVCTYNGERTIRSCLDGLLQLDYPNHEVIVVDDGSTDLTAEIIRQYPFRLITTENRGLGSARNTGCHAAVGEIVAYIDDDAYPDPDWLKYLAITFMTTGHSAVGGPNLAPPQSGRIEQCVARAPGGPVHVLLSDREAEHIPGCNMAIRKSCLEAIGGFDEVFRVAGDDVDVCWRLQQHGWTIGFSPAAVVWHHRRNSITAYWRQQRGYGKAEALLEAKWPEKYNSPGYPAWAGRIYSPGAQRHSRDMNRIFHGVWGSAAFQSVYEPAPGFMSSLFLMPEWYLVIGILALLSGFGLFWKPLLALMPLATAAIIATVTQAGRRAKSAANPRDRLPLSERSARLVLTSFLYCSQPLARLLGRLRHGLSPWRRREGRGWACPWRRSTTIWSEYWRAPEDWLKSVEAELRRAGSRVIRGGEYDRWDLEISDGTFGSVRLMSVVEEHGGGRQLIRFRLKPRWSVWPLLASVSLVLLSASAAWDGVRNASAVLAVVPLAFLLRIFGDTGMAMSTALRALRRVNEAIVERAKPPETEFSRPAAAQFPRTFRSEQTDPGISGK